MIFLSNKYETIINDATNFVNNDGRFAYEGRIALFYVLSELAEIYEEQDEDFNLKREQFYKQKYENKESRYERERRLLSLDE